MERKGAGAGSVDETTGRGASQGATAAAVPKVAVVAPPTPCTALDGVRSETGAVDLVARIISMGNCHRAFALTGANR